MALPRQSAGTWIYLAILFIVLPPAAGRARAQTVFSEEAVLLPRGASEHVGSQVAIDGNTALVSWRNDDLKTATSVFERNSQSTSWVEVATLPGDINFSPSLDGDVAIVMGDDGAPHVFERNHGGNSLWGDVTGLACAGDEFVASSSAVSGNTAVVGGFLDLLPSGFVPIACVFERNQGGAHAWGKVTILDSGSRAPNLGFLDSLNVSIHRDTIVVSKSERSDEPPINGHPFLRDVAYVFERNHGGANAWGRVARLPFGVPFPAFSFVQPPLVDIDEDTMVLGTVRVEAPLFFTAAHIFERNSGGPNAWGKVALLTPAAGPAFANFDVGIKGNRIAVTAIVSNAEPGTVHVYARNQGDRGNWGRVAILTSSHGTWSHGHALAVGADTIVTGAPDGDSAGNGGLASGAAYAFAIDTDGDGLRDGQDPCPRDPLNNVGNRCRRSAATATVVDDRMASWILSTARRNDEFAITALFENQGQAPIRNPFFVVTELSGSNVLQNADEGTAGPGATLSPDVGNGVLEPGEFTEVTFVIRLGSRTPFRFVVGVRGELD
jgi:hypothetical protein